MQLSVTAQHSKPNISKSVTILSACVAMQLILTDVAGFYMDGKYRYSGEWNNDRMQGSGKFTYASGTAYDGQWENSEYHGTGAFSWPDGRSYKVKRLY